MTVFRKNISYQRRKFLMAFFFTKNLYFRTKHSFVTPFSLSSYFHTHPITLLLEILGGRMHEPSPQIWGDRPPSRPKVSAHGLVSPVSPQLLSRTRHAQLPS